VQDHHRIDVRDAPNALNKILLRSAVTWSGTMVLMQNIASTVADAASQENQSMS
jgi:hypothetical protein